MENKTSKEKNAIDFYMLYNKLNEIIRTGWISWNVKRDRVESIAEHVYGAQMLALGMYFAYEDYKNIDIKKVILMLALHETEETIIGDISALKMSDKERNKIGHVVVEQVDEKFCANGEIKDLNFEFDEGKTLEAKYARSCDKLQWDLQSIIYDREGCVNINTKADKDPIVINNQLVKKMLEAGKSFSEICLLYSQERYAYDENFMNVSNYALVHKTKKLVRKNETNNK